MASADSWPCSVGVDPGRGRLLTSPGRAQLNKKQQTIHGLVPVRNADDSPDVAVFICCHARGYAHCGSTCSSSFWGQ
eukprot:356925-Chlamydomonas_euryale.AAC.3